MAFPSVRSSSYGEDTGASGDPSHCVHVVLPPTIGSGDTIIVFIAQDGYDEVSAGASGFTRLCWGYNSGQDVVGAIFWRKAAGTEDGSTAEFAGNTLQFAYACYSFQNATDPSIHQPTFSSMAEGTDTTAEPPVCNPGVSDDYYWLALAGCDHRTFSTYPADMTLDRLSAGTSSILNASCATAGKQNASASYTPSGTFGLTSADEWIAWTIAIWPYTATTNIPLAGAITAASAVQGTLLQSFAVPPVVTDLCPFLEFYSHHDAAWIDISNRVRSWSVDWGASGILEQIRARTATFILDNSDRRFEPMYTTGTYYPEITVGAYINCGLTVTSTDTTTTYPLFYGVAQSWQPGYSSPPARDAICRLEACDPNIVLAQDLTSVNLAANTSDQQISYLLDERLWSGSIAKDLETGNSTLQAYDASKESILSLINQVVESEAGWFYWQPGIHTVTARFLNRLYLSTQTTDTVYYLDDQGTNGQYTDIRLACSDDHIYSRALVTRAGGTQQNYQDGTLGPALGERTYTVSGLLLASDNEAYDRAVYIVNTRARAAYNLYCSTIKTTLALGQQRYAHGSNVLGLTQPFALFAIIHHPNTGTALTFNCRVVGGTIGQSSPGDLVRIVGNVVDATIIGGDYWILQDAVRGVLETTTILGW